MATVPCFDFLFHGCLDYCVKIEVPVPGFVGAWLPGRMFYTSFWPSSPVPPSPAHDDDFFSDPRDSKS